MFFSSLSLLLLMIKTVKEPFFTHLPHTRTHPQMAQIFEFVLPFFFVFIRLDRRLQEKKTRKTKIKWVIDFVTKIKPPPNIHYIFWFGFFPSFFFLYNPSGLFDGDDYDEDDKTTNTTTLFIKKKKTMTTTTTAKDPQGKFKYISARLKD